jgi:hypothetical protein
MPAMRITLATRCTQAMRISRGRIALANPWRREKWGTPEVHGKERPLLGIPWPNCFCFTPGCLTLAKQCSSDGKRLGERQVRVKAKRLNASVHALILPAQEILHVPRTSRTATRSNHTVAPCFVLGDFQESLSLTSL